MARDNSRETILDRAVQMASVQGLDGLSIGGVAAAVAMSKGGICAHFPSKSSLQAAVVERAAEVFRAAVVEPIFSRPPGLARLRALTDVWFAYLAAETFEGGCFFTNALLELDNLEEVEARSAVAGQYGRYLDLIERLAVEAIARGELLADLDPRRFAFELLGSQLGVLVWRGLGKIEEGFSLARAATDDLIARSAAA